MAKVQGSIQGSFQGKIREFFRQNSGIFSGKNSGIFQGKNQGKIQGKIQGFFQGFLRGIPFKKRAAEIQGKSQGIFQGFFQGFFRKKIRDFSGTRPGTGPLKSALQEEPGPGPAGTEEIMLEHRALRGGPPQRAGPSGAMQRLPSWASDSTGTMDDGPTTAHSDELDCEWPVSHSDARPKLCRRDGDASPRPGLRLVLNPAH